MTLHATLTYICTCGHVLRPVPAPQPDCQEERPAQWQYECRNRECEHSGKKFQAPGITRVRLQEVAR